jgi:hypothetical protein
MFEGVDAVLSGVQHDAKASAELQDSVEGDRDDRAWKKRLVQVKSPFKPVSDKRLQVSIGGFVLGVKQIPSLRRNEAMDGVDSTLLVGVEQVHSGPPG